MDAKSAAGRHELHGAGPGISAELRECLESARRRRRRLGCLEVASAAGLAAGTSVLVLFGADNLLHLGSTFRWTLLLGALATLALVLARGLRRSLRGQGDAECALLVEGLRPELENRLINAVLLRRAEHRGVQAAWVDLVEDDALKKTRPIPWKEVFRAAPARRMALLGCASLICVALYAALLPQFFLNAASRFARPFSHVPPITRTILHVRPGSADLRPGESLVVTAEVQGMLPERAVFHSTSGVSTDMRFNGKLFEHAVGRPGADFSYRVEAGDATSDEFQVRILRPPQVKDLRVTVEGPAYAGLPPRTEEGSSGNVEALAGSRIRLELQGSAPLAGAKMTRRGGPSELLRALGPDRFELSVLLESSFEYDLELTDRVGLSSPPEEFRRKMTALPDAPPTCEILDPSRDLALPAGTPAPLAVVLRAADDVGLADAALLVAWESPAALSKDGASARGLAERPAGEAQWQVVAAWEDCRGQREAIASASLDLPSLLSSPGKAPSALSCRARVRDLKGSETFSRAFKVTFTSETNLMAALKESVDRARASLAEILRKEEALVSATSALASAAGSAKQEGDASIRGEAVRLASEQDGIRSSLARIVKDLRFALPESTEARRELALAAAELMPGVSFHLLRSAEARSGTREAFVRKALAGERRIVAILLRALGALDSLARDAGGTRSEEGTGSRQAELSGIRGQLRDLLERLEDFAREQKEVIAGTQALADKIPEDFTEEDSRALEELAATEEKWGKYLDEKGTDLSKVAAQDMSLGVLCQEIVELVEEIDLARDYLKGKNIELAVPLEQSGVALSEKIETNIERWLSRDRDRLKWVMEEPVEEYDVPLADLPSELEDIVGELIDQEDLLSEETEDVTSSWLDSMDDGVGWDAMDGPISNMSAKGVTGNLQPNDMEIGGRSGEGRSGKSQGQFVEETASGKGGRQTPSRSTADPFESGEVKDTGRDATGGATGGGKLAGAGPEGLRGPPSPELDRKMGALAGRQTALRERAEKLDLALERRRYYSQDLQRALDLMKAMEKALASRRPYNYEALRKQIVSDLRGLGKVLSGEVDRKLEAAAFPPREREAEPLNAAPEEAPKEYQDLIRDYYRALGRVEASGAPGRKGGKQ